MRRNKSDEDKEVWNYYHMLKKKRKTINTLEAGCTIIWIWMMFSEQKTIVSRS